MPKTLAKANIQPLQSAFLCKGPLLCLKWRGPKTKSKKKPVTILSTIHAAKEVLTKKKDFHGNRISKPQCIQEYTQNMSSVDISDQYMAFHVNLHKSMKWSRKLFFHLFNMLLLNAFILNKKYGKTKLSKDDFLEHIANYLLESGTEGATCLQNHSTLIPTQYSRLTECHFIQNYTKNDGSKVHLVQKHKWPKMACILMINYHRRLPCIGAKSVLHHCALHHALKYFTLKQITEKHYSNTG